MKKTSTARQHTAPKRNAFRWLTHRHQAGLPASHSRSRIIGKPKSARQWWLPPSQIRGTGPRICKGLTLPDGSRRAPASTTSKKEVTTETFDVEPMAAWMAIEDLWLRLLAHCTVKLSCQHGIHELTVVGLKTATLDGHASQLLTLVADLTTYAWQVKEHRGQFIDGIDYQGNDLVLQIKPMTHIERWPDGEQMACEVKDFMFRLQELVNRRSTSTLANAGGASL